MASHYNYNSYSFPWPARVCMICLSFLISAFFLFPRYISATLASIQLLQLPKTWSIHTCYFLTWNATSSDLFTWLVHFILQISILNVTFPGRFFLTKLHYSLFLPNALQLCGCFFANPFTVHCPHINISSLGSGIKIHLFHHCSLYLCLAILDIKEPLYKCLLNKLRKIIDVLSEMEWFTYSGSSMLTGRTKW